MTHTQVYIILGVGLFITGFGGLVIYKEVQFNFPFLPGRNVLVRRHGDIELQDYIQPLDNTRDIDLSSLPQYPTNQAIINHTPIRWDLYPVPRYSQLTEISAPGYSQLTENSGNILPRYSNLTDNYINCPLENIINPDFIIWIISFFMMVLVVVILLKIILHSKEFHVIIIMALIAIIYYNLNYLSLGAMSLLIPFSVFDINFRDSFDWEFDSYRAKHKISYLKIQTLTEDLIKLLNSLMDDKDYSMSLSFISSYKEWQENKDKIVPKFIDDAIIINKESDPILITQFIMNRLNDKNLFVTNWLLNNSSINTMDQVILTVTVAIKIEI